MQDDVLIEAYARLGSVHKVGAELGFCHTKVHRRLTALGVQKKQRVLTEGEKACLLTEYNAAADAGKLNELAAKLGRSKTYIATCARELGLTNRNRAKPYFITHGPRVPMFATKEERRAHQSKIQKERILAKGHPRGMLGKKHSDAVKQHLSKMSTEAQAALSLDEKSRRVMKAMKTTVARHGTLAKPRPNTTWKAGWREIGGVRKYYRSRWEANYARYLQWLQERGEIARWQHEPETFWFEAIKRGVRSYLPDFRVWENNGTSRLHEVKGWMCSRSKTTLRRMAKYHPQETILLVSAKQYAAIEKACSSLIEGWE